MAQPSVVVAFTSRCGSTEVLAHAAAVGTVNARTLPRLRRLAPDDGPTPPSCADTFRRLQREYVPPTEKDISGSEGLVVVPSAGMTPASVEWAPFFSLLDTLAATGALAGKACAVIDAGDAQTVTSFSAALAARGVDLIPSAGGDARAHGRAVGAAIVASVPST